MCIKKTLNLKSMKNILNHFWFQKPNLDFQRPLLTLKIFCILIFCGVINVMAVPSASISNNISVNLINSSVDDLTGTDLVADQQKSVSGTITDAATGQPMPGVNITVKGTTAGTLTDGNGKYTLAVQEPGTAVLVFSFIGYGTKEVPVSGQTSIDLIMEASLRGLDEVVVVGYGTSKRADLTGSVGSMGSKDLKETNVTRVEQALSGKVAGVQVKMTDGQPGVSPQIRIRGIGSISAGVDPLYVVDGFPTGSIQTLNPNDIESVDILKDASATAIYGSRGSNGVVLITTKRGSLGKAKINFDTYYGQQSVTRVPHFMNAMQQATYYYNSIRNWNIDNGQSVTGDPATWNKRVPQTVLDVMSGANTTDVSALDAVLRTAPIKGYNLSVSGGNEAVKYAISGEYLDQDGIILNSNFKRYSLRANIDAQLTRKLALKINLNPSYTINHNVIAEGGGAGASTSIIGSATSAQPYYPLYNPDGSYFIYRTIDASTDLYNPIALALEKQAVTTGTMILGNINAEYEIISGLKFNVMFGTTLSSSKGYQFKPNLPVFYSSAEGTDNASSGLNWLAEYTLNYIKSFGKHNITALAGYTAQRDKSDVNTMYSNVYPNNLVPSIIAATSITSGSGSTSEWSIVSQLARVNYNYGGKYFVTASLRRDGSSRFGANNKYGVFPSAALAWRLSDETFMKNIPLIDLLKLRVSYGKTGNNNIGNYASLATISYLKYGLAGTGISGFAPSVIPNPDLTWETQEQLNAGIDIGFFKGRLNFNVDHFISRNVDLLLNVNVPAATGYTTALKNIGEVKNTGWEFVMSSVISDSKFKWTADFNLSAYKNEVVKLGPSGDDIISGNNITRIGQPIGMFYGFIVDGIFKSSAELAAGPIYNKGLSDATRVGDIKFRDVSGPDGVPDGIITNADMTIMGSPYPDFYYGITNRMSYQNLSLNFSIAGSKGNQIYSNAMVIYRLIRSRSRTLTTELNYWKSEEDPGDGNTVKPCDVPSGGLRLASTRYMDTGSYLRFNNITLGYTLPDKISQKIMLSSLRFYLSATNPIIITKNLSFNPDVSNSGNSLTPGIDNNNYPLPKSYVIGINVTF
jgi:TonB-linked SusC/RagA family outer membrane protein